MTPWTSWVLPPAGPRPGTPSSQVETTLFRALAVLRAIMTVYAVALNATRLDEAERPALVVGALGVLVAWSVVATWAYDAPVRRRLPLYLVDLAVAVALLAITPLVQSDAMLERNAASLPTFWVVVPVLAWAVGRGGAEALGAAALVAAADLSVRERFTGTVGGNLFLLLLATGVVAYAVGVLRQAAELRAAAERAAAAAEERTRLSRAVHDGVLQVLGLVQRRGAEAGGEWAELGRLAGAQERELRALVQYDARVAEPSGPAGRDLVAALEVLGDGAVTVTGPGRPVRLPAAAVDEVAAAVGACLDNVRRHVGADAAAWVLVEDLGSSVVVTVRDEGPGIPQGRLDQAREEGRLGVSGSICGRIADLGGRAEIITAPGQGVEWELTVPKGDSGGR